MCSNSFKPFGEDVRIGVVGYADGNQELAANLSDLCEKYELDFLTASQAEYPSGSITMLNPLSHGFGGELYLTESAYSVFMRVVVNHEG